MRRWSTRGVDCGILRLEAGAGGGCAFGSKGWRASANPTALRRPSKPPLWSETGAYGIQYVSAFSSKSPRVLIAHLFWLEQQRGGKGTTKTAGERQSPRSKQARTSTRVECLSPRENPHGGGARDFPRALSLSLANATHTSKARTRGTHGNVLLRVFLQFHAMWWEERTQPKRTRHGCCPQQVGRGGALHGYFSQHATHPPKKHALVPLSLSLSHLCCCSGCCCKDLYRDDD